MANTNRRGFTLVELLVVIGIMVLLATMTIGAINLGVTTEQIRSGSRQVQSVIEGSRDRAIYAGEARGIRLIVDDNDPNICTSIIYIGSPGAYESETDESDANRNGNREEANPAGPFVNVFNPDASLYPPGTELAAKALIGVGTRWRELAEQKLIRAGSRIRINPDSVGQARDSTDLLTIHPASFPVRTESQWFGNGDALDLGTDDPNGNGSDDEVIFTTTPSRERDSHGLGVVTPLLDGNWHFAIDTEADILPGEEPSILPKNCVIDLETSHLPANWVVVNPSTGAKQFSNRMDLMFAPGGSIVGQAASAGVIHLHVCHLQDAIDNVPPGSQTLDGTANGEPRQGDEFGATIFTKTGRVIIHPIDWSSYPVPASEVANTAFVDAADVDNDPQTLGYWQASTAYSVGDTVAPLQYDGNVYVAQNAGSTDTAEPRWNRLAGGETLDPPVPSGVRWRAVRHNVWGPGLSGELSR